MRTKKWMVQLTEGPGEVKVCVETDSQPGLPMQAGKPARQDYTYERKGSCNLFVMLAPEQGWRDVVVTERRTKED